MLYLGQYRGFKLQFLSLFRHLPPNHKLATEVIACKRSMATAYPSPHRASKMCCALKPSLPREVPLGNDLTYPRTLSTPSTRGASEKKCTRHGGRWLVRVFSPQSLLGIFIIRSHSRGAQHFYSRREVPIRDLAEALPDVSVCLFSSSPMLSPLWPRAPYPALSNTLPTNLAIPSTSPHVVVVSVAPKEQ